MSDGYLLRDEDGQTRWFLDTRMTVKADGAATGGAFTLLEWAAPPGFGPPRHVHHGEDEAFYLLDGGMSVECGERRWDAGPGDFVFLPRGVAHTFLVTSGPLRGLQLTSPAGFEGLLDEIGRPAQHPGLPEPSIPDIPRLVEAVRRHGGEIVGPPLALHETTADR
jgi:mannose-6-phosphate isomerase-like protein (cupin superfamily)